MTYEQAEALLGKPCMHKLLEAATDDHGCYLTGVETDAVVDLLLALPVEAGTT